MKRTPPIAYAAPAAKRPSPGLSAYLSDAARACADPASASATDVEAVMEAVQFYGIDVPSPWTLDAQCDQLGAVGGPAWSSAVQAHRDRVRALVSAPNPNALLAALYAARRGRQMASAAQPARSYEQTLPLDVQYEIMRRTVQASPQSALDLATASTAQRSLLRSIPARALAAGGGFSVPPGESVSTGLDYARALVAMGAGADAVAVSLAQALCLMQAFARYLFRDEERLRADMPEYYRANPMARPHADAVSVESILDRLGIIDRPTSAPRAIDVGAVRDWYSWLTTAPGTAARRQWRSVLSPLLARWLRAIGSSGQWRQGIASDAATPIGPVNPVPGPSVQSIGRQTGRTMVEIINAYADRSRGPSVTVDDFERWRETRGRDPAVRRALASSEVDAAFKTYLDERVAANHGGPCLAVQRATGLSLPSFTSVFDVDLYAVPGDREGTWYLAASVRSPRIESLLGLSVPRARRGL